MNGVMRSESEMPRRLRARDDIEWGGVGIGTAVGLLLMPGLPLAGYNLAIWTREPAWFSAGMWGTPVAAIVAILIAFRSIWTRLIVALLCVPIWLYLHIGFVISYGCSMQVELGLPLTACL